MEQQKSLSKQRILVTGGLGFIGSHTVVQLCKISNYQVFIVDNLSNSSIKCLDRLQKITNRKLQFQKLNVHDKIAMLEYFQKIKPTAVLHFASLKAVGESVQFPLKYYGENISGTISLLQAMAKYGCTKFIFSSSATVYGHNPHAQETDPIQPTNPYGFTKSYIQQILKDQAHANGKLRVICLRYFNPIGAHQSGLIGESPKDIPNNLMPFIQQVAVKNLKELSVFGNDYNTVDGTGVRDYIHVVDLAKGHIVALGRLNEMEGGSWDAINLGTGNGTSVLQLVKSFEEESGVTIPYKITGRRPGDVEQLLSKVGKSAQLLKWKTEKNIKDMCKDSWRWVKGNPNGYE